MTAGKHGWNTIINNIWNTIIHVTITTAGIQSYLTILSARLTNMCAQLSTGVLGLELITWLSTGCSS